MLNDMLKFELDTSELVKLAGFELTVAEVFDLNFAFAAINTERKITVDEFYVLLSERKAFDYLLAERQKYALPV